MNSIVYPCCIYKCISVRILTLDACSTGVTDMGNGYEDGPFVDDLPINTSLVGGWATPLKNMSSSIGMMTFPIYGKIKFMATKPPTTSDSA